MKTISLSCFLLFLSLLPVFAQEANPIQRAMADYDYRTVLTLIAEEEPSIPLLYQKATALKGLGRNREALQAYREILQQDSLSTRAHIEAAECCKSLAMQQAAIGHYRQALRLSPDHVYARIQYIRLLQMMRRFDAALVESRTLVAEDSSAMSLHLLAQSYEGKEEIPSALECYHCIRERWPDDFLAVAKLGELYSAGKDYEQAIRITEEYRDVDSTNVLVNRQNALAYCLSGRYPEAIRRYEALLAQGDSTAHTCYSLGISYYAKDRLYEACEVLELARRQTPKDVNLLYYLGRACSRSSWKEKGIGYMKQAIEYAIPSDSAIVRLYVGLSECYKEASRWSDHLELLKFRYANYERNNHRLLYNMAYDYCFSLKNPKEAERCLEAFLKTRPDGEGEGAVLKNGGIEAGDVHLYNAAERWLKDLRANRRTEEFFQGKAK